jgi:hypothetical protein
VDALACPAERTGVTGRGSDRLRETAVHDRVTDKFVDPARENVGGLVSAELICQLGHAFQVDLHQRSDEVIARREMPVESSDTDAGSTSDLVERGAHPVATKRVAGDTQKALTVAAGVGPEIVHRSFTLLFETEALSV